jgi:hypothetical protein
LSFSGQAAIREKALGRFQFFYSASAWVLTFQGVPDQVHQAIRGKGFFKINAILHLVQSLMSLFSAKGSHKDADQGWTRALGFANQIDTVQARHFQVRDQEIKGSAEFRRGFDEFQGLLALSSRSHFITGTG